MKIARVFPTRTSMSPMDKDAYFGPPDLFTPAYDAVHVSVVFTWDLAKAAKLKCDWEHIAPVTIGGVAIDGEPKDGFMPGKYVREGVIFTSRGCPNKCPWCFVQSPLREIEICSGNIVQDNNLLACSDSHIAKVFQMLSHEKAVRFQGGLEADRVTPKIVEQLRGIRVADIWIALDDISRKESVIRAVDNLKKYFRRDQIRCFVLIGFGRDTLDKAEGRLREAWEIGTLPFAMLYRDKAGSYPQPEKEWRQFQRSWVRPAAIRTTMNRRAK